MTTKDCLPHHVTCKMCSGPFSDPRILPCLHSLCCQCLHKEMENVGPQESLQCPTCLRNVPIPVGGAFAFPQNLHLVFEVEVAGYISKLASSSGVSCTFCVKGCNDPAVVFCCSCHMFMCKGGQECHNRAPQLSQHNVIGLDRESATLLPTLIKPTDHHCSDPKHMKQGLYFYCKTCSCFICQLCVTPVHKDHNITELSTVAEADRDEMRGTLQCAQEVVSILAGAIDANKKMMQQVETSKQEAELAIMQTFKQLMETLEERKKMLLMELETITLSKTTSLTLQKEQFEKTHHDISYYSEVTSHILKTHTDHELVALRGLVPIELKRTLKKVENMSLTPNPRSYLSATLQTDMIAEVLSTFGTIVDLLTPDPSKCTCAFKSVSRVNRKYHVNVEIKTSKGERYPCGGLQVKAKLRPKSFDGPVVLGQVEDHGDGTYTITLTPQTAGPHQLLITVDGHHVQGSPYDLEVKSDYTSLRDVQQVINVKGKPSCVAIHENGDVYVGSDDGHIYVYDQGGHLKNTIGSNGSGDGQFKVPCSISIIREVMYIADFGNHRIQKLSTRGKFLNKFGKGGSGKGQFKYPHGVVVDSKNRVIVSDMDNNMVQVFSQDGDWLWTIDGTGNNSFKAPWGLSLDPQGNIHVAAAGSNTIKVFAPEGTYVRSYGDVKTPSGIAVDEEGYSYVSECDGGCFSIFDPKGQKIHTVGNLNKPRGVALDPLRGSLYVPNFNNSTVLKYIM